MKKSFLFTSLLCAITAVANPVIVKKTNHGKSAAPSLTLALPVVESPARFAAPVNRNNSVIYWSDDFSNPANWVTSIDSGIDTWVIGTNGPVHPAYIDTIRSATVANGFAMFDSDGQCNGNQIANLETASTIDLSTATSARIVFSQFYRHYYDSTFLFISNDSGATWNKINVNPITQNDNFNSNNAPNGAQNPEIISINITSLAAGHSGVKLKFQFYSPASLDQFAGCAYTWMLDDISIQDVPPGDIGILNIDPPSEYCIIPYDQIHPLQLAASVKNFGIDTAFNVAVQADVFDANGNNVYSSIDTPLPYLLSGDTSAPIVCSIPFVPTDTGRYTFRYISTSTSVDGNSSNDTAFQFVRVSNGLYARDYTAFTVSGYAGAYGFQGFTGYLGNIFGFRSAAQVTYADLFVESVTIGDSASIKVFNVNAGVPDTNAIATTVTHVFSAADTGGVMLRLPFSSPLSLNPGQYLFAVHQKDTNNVAIGASTRIFTPNRSYFRITGDVWVAVENYFNICFILRVNAPTTSVGISADSDQPDYLVFPNPTTGTIRISGDPMPGTVVICNGIGQLVFEKRFERLDHVRIDLPQLPEGLYTVRIQTDDGVATRKILIGGR